MSGWYSYNPLVFNTLVPILLELEQATNKVPKSIKCFPEVNYLPHVHMEDCAEFRAWAREHNAWICPWDGPEGYVKLLVDIRGIRVYAIIPEVDAGEYSSQREERDDA